MRQLVALLRLRRYAANALAASVTGLSTAISVLASGVAHKYKTAVLMLPGAFCCFASTAVC